MIIDDRVEALTRAALDAAVHKDTSRFQLALGEFRDDQTASQATQLLLAVVAAVLFEVNDGMPSRQHLADLAEEMAEQERWIDLSAGDIESFLLAVALGETDRLSGLNDNASILAFVVTANLLTTASQPEEGEWWFNYLDKVEAAIEAAA